MEGVCYVYYRRKQSEEIDKFFTFHRKNEEFQKILDREYEKVKTGNIITEEMNAADVASSEIDVHDLRVRLRKLYRIFCKLRIVCNSQCLNEHSTEVLRERADVIVREIDRHDFGRRLNIKRAFEARH